MQDTAAAWFTLSTTLHAYEYILNFYFYICIFLNVDQVGDSIVERYKQAARTGLLSEVLQEGAAVFGALLIKCPLAVSVFCFIIILFSCRRRPAHEAPRYQRVGCFVCK